MNRNKIERIKQWIGRIGAAVFTLVMCILTVGAVMDKSYALASVFVFFIALIIVCYVHDERAYAKWKKDNGDEGADDGK